LNNYYIYIYLDPRKSGKYLYGEYEFEYKPFYIGKGKNRRYLDKCGRNPIFKNKINKIKKSELEPIIIKLYENLNEKESFEKEIELIEKFGRIELGTGPLVNMTIGGDGKSGNIVSEETKKKIRKDFSDIKKEFERRNYILLSEEKDYKNAFTKLKYICNEGHECFISWSNFQRGCGCSVCDNEKQKKIFYDIKQEFERRKYKLLTEEKDYKDNDTKLKYICPKGHEGYISWNSFQQGRGCPIEGKKSGSKKLRKNFQEIKKEFERRNYILLTEEKDYENIYTKLNYICPKGHEGSICWNNFQQGRCCPICGKKHLKHINIKLGETT